MPKPLFAVLLTVFLISNGCESTSNVSGLEYDVYFEVLRQGPWGREQIEDANTVPLVISRETSVTRILRDSDTTGSSDDWIREELPSIRESTLLSFWQRNRAPAALTEGGFSRTAVALISKEEVAEYFDHRTGVVEGWRAFYRAYPNTNGLLTLSRVGISAGGNQGLIYLGNQRGALDGYGVLLLLEKTKGEWRIVAEMVVWIS